MPDDELEARVRDYAKQAAALPAGDKREAMIEAYAGIVIEDYHRFNKPRATYMLGQFNKWVIEYREKLQKEGGMTR
jgi:hypothetical protein